MTPVRDAIYARTSTRRFDPDRPVEQEKLERVLTTALQAPSSSNTQPYKLAVATGATRDAISKELAGLFAVARKLKRMSLPRQAITAILTGSRPTNDVKVMFDLPPEIHKRRSVTGHGLYELLGIDRKDLKARDDHMARNFDFFDAPVAIFVFAYGPMEHHGALDTGIFLQTLMLAAHEEGLSTCPQGALALWSHPVRKHFKVPKDYKLICGVSLGYAADHHVNKYKPGRVGLDELLLKEKK
ncbi:MAG: nitroreductase [Deltaproteobacteria bacterium]|nr:nitroreductase [Deltaproteobacteria bacterium]